MKKLTVLFLLATIFCSSLFAQNSNFGKAETLIALKNAKDEIKKHYYDKEYHGINLDEHFKQAEEKVKQAQNTGQFMGIVAQALIDFDDSHLFFLPPPRMNKSYYGIEFRAQGENVFIYAVQPGSDAATKGLRPGDRLISINGFPVIREKLWVLKYLFYALRPQPALRVVLQSPDQAERTVDFNAKVIEGKQNINLMNTIDRSIYIRERQNEAHVYRHQHEKLGDDIFIWKMPQFDLIEEDVDIMFGRIKKCKSLILDLRGNAGGAIDTLKRMVTDLFDREIKIAERNGRKELKAIVAKRFAGNFEGKVIVLIDNDSASCSEVLARVIQLEKRGTVIGDRSAGAVMESMHYHFQLGMSSIITYGFSITESDIITSDGKSLEHKGVTPDEVINPSSKDLAAGRDPVMARAVEILGGKLTSEDAGKMFPIEWIK